MGFYVRGSGVGAGASSSYGASDSEIDRAVADAQQDMTSAGSYGNRAGYGPNYGDVATLASTEKHGTSGLSTRLQKLLGQPRVEVTVCCGGFPGNNSLLGLHCPKCKRKIIEQEHIPGFFSGALYKTPARLPSWAYIAV